MCEYNEKQSDCIFQNLLDQINGLRKDIGLEISINPTELVDIKTAFCNLSQNNSVLLKENEVLRLQNKELIVDKLCLQEQLAELDEEFCTKIIEFKLTEDESYDRSCKLGVLQKELTRVTEDNQRLKQESLKLESNYQTFNESIKKILSNAFNSVGISHATILNTFDKVACLPDSLIEKQSDNSKCFEVDVCYGIELLVDAIFDSRHECSELRDRVCLLESYFNEAANKSSSSSSQAVEFESYLQNSCEENQYIINELSVLRKTLKTSNTFLTNMLTRESIFKEKINQQDHLISSLKAVSEIYYLKMRRNQIKCKNLQHSLRKSKDIVKELDARHKNLMTILGSIKVNLNAIEKKRSQLAYLNLT